MSFQVILDEVEKNITKILGDLQCNDVAFSVSPSKPGFGDVSCNVSFLLAKQLKKSPQNIAQIISAKYEKCEHTLVSAVKAHESGYVNFIADWKKLSTLILLGSFSDEFGYTDLGKGMTVVVEHTSVNPNKALHIGHVRNIIVGDVISRLLQKTNHKVNVLNYIDDSGLQVADIIIGFRHFGFPEDPPEGKKFDHYCGDDVYVKTTAKYDDDPSLQDIRKEILSEIEDGTSEIAQFASRITQRVLANQLETCWNLGVTYDCLNFESQIIRSGLWGETFEKLKKMKLVEYDDVGENSGCWVIRGHDNDKDKVLVRSTGTATYIAKDIPYAAWKLGLLDDPFGYIIYGKKQPSGKTLWQTTLDDTSEKCSFAGSKVITVIDSRQARLQNIIADLMSKFESEGAYVHLGYESVTLSSDTAKILGLDTEGRQAQMSGRKGLYVNADSVYDSLLTRTAEETARRHSEMDISEIDQIAHHVSVGTLRYEMIKQDLDKIITFDLAKSLNLEGDTAPYIQYTYARASRILEKSTRPHSDADCTLLSEQAELQLIRMIGMFGISVRDATINLSPKVVARYCHDLAVTFNEFYEKVRVLGLDDTALEDSRVHLVASFKTTLKMALDLLGISSPEKM